MLKKIFLSFLIFFILYILAIFKVPMVAETVEGMLRIEGFNQFVINFKKTYDNTVTNLPSKQGIVDTYSQAYSGALEAKNMLEEGVSLTKEKVDDVRKVLSGAEDTYNTLKSEVEQAKDIVDKTRGKLDTVKEVIDDVSELTNSGGKLTSTGTIQ